MKDLKKKLEIVVKLSAGDSLRNIKQPFWNEVVSASGAQILSSIHNSCLSAYLLSESSLFVWDDRIVMITCGETKLIQAVHTFLKRFPKEDILSLIFQRKNEYCSHLQKTNFFSDIESLKSVFSGQSFRFGNTDGHHNFLYHLNKEFAPSPSDYTHELLMYHLGSDAKSIFCQEGQQTSNIREFLKLNKYFSDWKIDDFVGFPGFSWVWVVLRAARAKKVETKRFYTPPLGGQKTQAYCLAPQKNLLTGCVSKPFSKQMWRPEMR